MKYLGDSFSVFPGSEKNYRDNYDRIFGKKKEKTDPWADERDSELPGPKKMSDLLPARDVQSAPSVKKSKKTKSVKKNEKSKTKKKAKNK